MTKVEKFEVLLNIEDVKENPMLVEFIENEIELIKKKNAYKSTNKKKTAEDTELYKEIESVFLDNPVMMFSCSDVVRHLNFKYSTQKLAPKLNAMVESGILKVSVEKKQKRYSLAE